MQTVDDDTLKRVARAICAADDNDPDAMINTGSLESVRTEGGGYVQQHVQEPMWHKYIRQARIHIAADHAIKVRS